jgi:uncharacterized protein YbbC (DUF1343 family)
MKRSRLHLLPTLLLIGAACLLSGMKPLPGDISNKPSKAIQDSKVIPGADQTHLYLPYLKGKRVAMLINASSRIGNQVSVDSLTKLGINVIKIFAPEHGFRDYAQGTIPDKIDPETGIPIVSVYGAKRKPAKEDLADVDIVIFDLQDVGVRFYTYISTLHYAMEACAENNVEMMIFDRPNPNGFYVDGPVMVEEKLKSFVSMHPTPTVHGMTIGEYAQMINGEGWLLNKVQTKLNIVKVANWTHDTPYTLPVKPSPALMTQQSVLLYPSLCLFEGTTVSQGRSSDYSFEALGSAALEGIYSFSFTSTRNPDTKLYGINLKNYDTDIFRQTRQLNIAWVLELYKAFPDKSAFFRGTTINTRLGSSDFINQITSGKTEAEIRQSWEPGLSQYKEMRKKYMLYP